MQSIAEALAAYFTSLETERKVVVSSCNLGIIAFKRGDKQGARTWFENALRIAEALNERYPSKDTKSILNTIKNYLLRL